MEKEDLFRWFAYNHWANLESLRSVEKQEHDKGLAVIAHIAGAEQLWLQRLRQEKVPPPVWPEWNAPRCLSTLEQLAVAWNSFLEELTPSQQHRTVRYVNSKGQPWENRIDDILQHVLLHSSYHRGQIASGLRGAGLIPPYTDYIHCIREGLFDS